MLSILTCCFLFCVCFFFQAEDGIRDLVRSRGLGDVYKRQGLNAIVAFTLVLGEGLTFPQAMGVIVAEGILITVCLLYTSDAADERSSVDLGGRRIIKTKHSQNASQYIHINKQQTVPDLL